MELFKELGSNFVLWTAVCGWFIAQLIKFILVLAIDRHIDFKRFVGSGGMPSSHTATVTSMAIAAGLTEGFGSIEFAICAIISFVVMYDACGVRRSAGEHAKILNKIMSRDGINLTDRATLKELLGHSPLEVFAGAVLGILVAVIAYQIR